MSLIDFNHHLGSQIGSQLLENAELENRLLIIDKLKPTFGKDGNQWFYMIGDLPEPGCLVGFGDTPRDAMFDFCKNFYESGRIKPPSN